MYVSLSIDFPLSNNLLNGRPNEEDKALLPSERPVPRGFVNVTSTMSSSTAIYLFSQVSSSFDRSNLTSFLQDEDNRPDRNSAHGLSLVEKLSLGNPSLCG
jgi:hypothetical protein